ncbi:retrovirus-related pol polyprotein from transposon TNT 1-94 [Tanacetum coccineum]
MKDKVVPNNSQVKDKKTEVEDHPRISSISNKTKSVTACNDSLKSITSNVNVIVQLILFIVNSGCTKQMTGNLKLLCNFVEKYLGTVRFGNDQFAPILGYGDLVQGNITINRGNDLLTGNHGSDLYTISLQETTSSTPICLMAKASPTQALLWHQRLSHLNFDYINLLSKKDVVIGLPKLKYVKDQLCSSCEVSKGKKKFIQDKGCSKFEKTAKFASHRLMGDGENLDKMKEKGDSCILVGYSTQSKGYRVYNKRTRFIVESIHLRFDEIKEMTKTSVANDTSAVYKAPQVMHSLIES